MDDLPHGQLHGASCSRVDFSMWRVVDGANCPWGDFSMGRVVMGDPSMALLMRHLDPAIGALNYQQKGAQRYQMASRKSEKTQI